VTSPPPGIADFEHFLASLSADSTQADRAGARAGHADRVAQLPAWPHQVLVTLFHGQDGDTAARWARRLFEELRRTDGQLAFEVVHDWFARTVVPMASPDATRLRELHARAAAGERFGEPDWLAALEPVLHDLYRDAYDYATAYATARASASAYAKANNFSSDGAVRFADSYAADSTEANRQSYAESNAIATAAALARASATADAAALAEAYPFALLHACAHASAHRAAGAEASDRDRAARRQAAYAHLADGLADSLARMA
jgi:hypothetical protein